MEIIIIGSGGHARVVKSLVELIGYKVIAVCDPDDSNKNHPVWKGIKFYKEESDLSFFDKDKVYIANGIGHMPHKSSSRKNAYNLLNEMGFFFPPLVHPVAWVSNYTIIEDGVQIMAGAVIQTGTKIDKNTIINTSASIDHDCKIGKNVHVAPGVVLCGDVNVGDDSFIGSGSNIIQSINVKKESFIKAGTIVVNDFKNNNMKSI